MFYFSRCAQCNQLGSDRRDRYPVIGTDDLHAMAIEFRVRDRHIGRREHDHQRCYAGDAVVGSAQSHSCAGIVATAQSDHHLTDNCARSKTGPLALSVTGRVSLIDRKEAAGSKSAAWPNLHTSKTLTNSLGDFVRPDESASILLDSEEVAAPIGEVNRVTIHGRSGRKSAPAVNTHFVFRFHICRTD